MIFEMRTNKRSIGSADGWLPYYTPMAYMITRYGHTKVNMKSKPVSILTLTCVYAYSHTWIWQNTPSQNVSECMNENPCAIVNGYLCPSCSDRSKNGMKTYTYTLFESNNNERQQRQHNHQTTIILREANQQKAAIQTEARQTYMHI